MIRSEDPDRGNQMQASIEYRRLRAPAENGSALVVPNQEGLNSLWQRNLTLAAGREEESGGAVESSRLLSARREIFKAAVDYTRGHRDLGFSEAAWDRLDLPAIVMAGHQPNLFHPGVWFKNFLLSALAKRWQATAINLVVDNDLCGASSLAVPVAAPGWSNAYRVPLDHGPALVPHEERQIEDDSCFLSFGDRVAASVGAIIAKPLIQQLWPLVCANRREDRLGLAIARGRHALEAELGIDTLELPISHLAKTASFAWFVLRLLQRPVDFVRVYNRVLNQYRRAYSIRNRSRPVPDLADDDCWLEMPLWIWDREYPRRRSLFVRESGGSLDLSDHREFRLRTSTTQLESVLLDLHSGEIRVRPKALMTTLFSRLLLSDLFVHGIGGSIYDQLTDAIAAEFFGVELPGWVTATATFRFFDKQQPAAGKSTGMLKSQAWQMRHHPELFVDANDHRSAEALIGRKRELIENRPSSDSAAAWHAEMKRCNEQLRQLIEPQLNSLLASIAQAKKQRRQELLLGSREFSYCLFDDSLSPQLADLANRKLDG